MNVIINSEDCLARNKMEEDVELGSILETINNDCSYPDQQLIHARGGVSDTVFSEDALLRLNTIVWTSNINNNVGIENTGDAYDQMQQPTPGNNQLADSPLSADSGFAGSETLSPDNRKCVQAERPTPGYHQNEGTKAYVCTTPTPDGMYCTNAWINQHSEIAFNCTPTANVNGSQCYQLNALNSTSSVTPGYIPTASQNLQSMPLLESSVQNFPCEPRVMNQPNQLEQALYIQRSKPPKAKSTKRGARSKTASSRSLSPPVTKPSSPKERQKRGPNRRKRTLSEDGFVGNAEQGKQTEQVTDEEPQVADHRTSTPQHDSAFIHPAVGDQVVMPFLNSEPVLPTDTTRPNNFISGFFDHNGGHLILRELGVKMFIPPGAIPRGRQQEIFMYLSWENKHQPVRDERKTQIGPVVVCGPNGLKFEENICINFKHCIDTTDDDWKVTAVYTATDIDERSQYELLVDPEKGDEQNALCLLDNDTCTILVDHFTGFGLQGEPRPECSGDEGGNTEKLYMYAMVYMAKHQHDIQLRVYVVKQIAGAEQWVEDEEKKIMGGGVKCEMTKPMALRGNKKDVIVTIENVTKGWKLFPNDKTERLLSFDTLWETGRHGCSYMLEDPSQQSTQFRCTIQVTQLDNNVENTAEFIISPENEEGVIAEPSKVVEKASLPRDVRLEMCHRLDPEHPLACDWRKFAEFLGYCKHIQMLESNKRFQSPTHSLLTIWECKKGVPNAQDIIDLIDFFRSIEREDVALILKGHVECTYGDIDSLRSKTSLSPADSGYSGSPRESDRSAEPSNIGTPIHKKFKVD